MKPRLAILILTVAACDSESGGKPGDIVWDAAANPHVVSTNLTIGVDERLVIEPGVRVELAEEVVITIAGELLAKGTEAAPIVFTQHVAGDRWGSLVFESSATDARFHNVDDYASGSILEWVTFEGANKAVQVIGSSPYIHRCVFRDHYSEETLATEGGAALAITQGSTTRVRECTFEDNEAELFGYGGAVFAGESNPIFQDNVFRNNSSVYGGALTTNLVASPIVGNLFENNEAGTKGGAVSLFSGISVMSNNIIRNNTSLQDGGGVHVCVDCYPHATPFFFDNTITGNVARREGAGGLGAAFLRSVTDNSIYGNLKGSAASEFGWFHDIEVEGYPQWVYEPSVANNWWGTAESDAVADLIFDGSDDGAYGVVTYEPVLVAAPTGPKPRVAITTRKLRYVDAGDPMPVFLTVYNPGGATDLHLVVMLQYGDGPAINFGGDLGIEGTSFAGGVHRLTLPENVVSFTTVLEPTMPAVAPVRHGFWHAALFESTGVMVGEVCTTRFDLVDGADGELFVGHGGTLEVGGDILRSGVNRASLTGKLGAAEATYDLGGVGVLLSYPGRGVSALIGGPGDLVRSLSTDDGGDLGRVALAGGDLGEVTSLGGESVADPFLGAAWHGGVVVEWRGDAVARVHAY